MNTNRSLDNSQILVNPKTRAAIEKYGEEVCLTASRLSAQGEGPSTIGIYTGLKTNQANAAINAGDVLSQLLHSEAHLENFQFDDARRAAAREALQAKYADVPSFTHSHREYPQPSEVFRIGYRKYSVFTLTGFYRSELAERTERILRAETAQQTPGHWAYGRSTAEAFAHFSVFPLQAYHLSYEAYRAEQIRRGSRERGASASASVLDCAPDHVKDARRAFFQSLPDLQWGDVVRVDGTLYRLRRHGGTNEDHVEFEPVTE